MPDIIEPPDRGDQILSACVQTLIDHFDSVRIVVTETDANETKARTLGAGNLFAQRGSVLAWLDGEMEKDDE